MKPPTSSIFLLEDGARTLSNRVKIYNMQKKDILPKHSLSIKASHQNFAVDSLTTAHMVTAPLWNRVCKLVYQMTQSFLYHRVLNTHQNNNKSVGYSVLKFKYCYSWPVYQCIFFYITP